MQKNWYAVITADVLYAEDLTPRQKLLMAVIANLSNEKGWCWASNAYFAEIMKCSIPSIQRDLRHLETSGYLGRAMQIGKDGKVEVRALTPISQTTPPHVMDDMTPMSPVIPPRVTSDTYNNKDNNKPNNKDNSGTLFKNSQYGNNIPLFIKDMKEYAGGKYQKYDLEHYWHQLLNWSSGKGVKRPDWLANCASFIRSDDKKGQAVMAKSTMYGMKESFKL